VGPAWHGRRGGSTPHPVPEALRAASWPFMAAVVFVFFGLLTVVSLAIGFLAEKNVQGRRIFSVPLAAGQLRFEARQADRAHA
jgi:hypothetical protein